MILKIDHEVLRSVDTGYEKYIFDLDTYLIVDKNSDEAEFVESPITFPFVAECEAERAFIKTLGKKTAQFFEDLTDEKDFMNWFWGTVDDGGQLLINFRIFEDKYHLKKITEWCEENNIPYFIDKNDWYIKNFIGE